MTETPAKALDEPSRAAMMAAVELEIESCIGAITTRGLAQKLDKIAATLRSPDAPRGREEIEAAILKFARCRQNPLRLTYETFPYDGAKPTSDALAFANAILALTPAPADARIEELTATLRWIEARDRRWVAPEYEKANEVLERANHNVLIRGSFGAAANLVLKSAALPQDTADRTGAGENERLRELLKEARQYVSDSGDDEDGECRQLSEELCADIDAALARLTVARTEGREIAALLKAAQDCVDDYYIASGKLPDQDGNDGYGSLRALRLALAALPDGEKG